MGLSLDQLAGLSLSGPHATDTIDKVPEGYEQTRRLAVLGRTWKQRIARGIDA